MASILSRPQCVNDGPWFSCIFFMSDDEVLALFLFCIFYHMVQFIWVRFVDGLISDMIFLYLWWCNLFSYLIKFLRASESQCFLSAWNGESQGFLLAWNGESQSFLSAWNGESQGFPSACNGKGQRIPGCQSTSGIACVKFCLFF